MEYNFRDIEKKWQRHWKETGAYKVSNDSGKPKFYVLDMFPYPSGAGLHVGHPLGYIASDIYARFKRLKGFNVLHPMGFDSFGLPAEQYAIETGQHPAVTTEKNIERYHEQLDNIGFCYDWSREVKTSEPQYYKWTQWIFLQLFGSWYNRQTQKAERIDQLISLFEQEGNASHECPGNEKLVFSASDWKNCDEKSRQDILMNYRIAYSAYGEVNWCEALGTVLANDEVVNGVSERGGHPVEKKKMRQWYLRITEYADRLLQGLETVDFSESMKDMQRNWIGKSMGAEITFTSPPTPLQRSWRGEEEVGQPAAARNSFPKYKVSDRMQLENARINRKESTEAEAALWEQLRNNKLGYKFRRQHPIEGFIADFACLQKGLIVEVDGGYHNTPEQQEYDDYRTKTLEELGFAVLRFTNEEVLENVYTIRNKIKNSLDTIQKATTKAIASETSAEAIASASSSPLSNSVGEGLGVRCYTTRPDTIFGVDFIVVAPEHELVPKITTPEQKAEIDSYLTYVKSRSERERLAEVKSITGAFTGAYAVNPFDGREIPIWISEYVLAGYGTGAIMAVPCGDQRDFAFAKHFGIPITNIIGEAYNGEEANPTKDAILQNSGFLNGMVMRDAISEAIDVLEEMGIGKRKINYRMRDAGFSRQRYWGEPFPIIHEDGIAYPLSEGELPLELPYVESYGPGPEGEGPLANIEEWVNMPSPKGEGSGSPALPPSPFQGEGSGMRYRETNTMPGYAGSSWYFLRYMDPHNDKEFADRKATDYWNQVDLYIGGTEHAVGHLLYSRMWTKALYDLGYIGFDEPYKKLVNQGMIQGVSEKLFRLDNNIQGEVEKTNWYQFHYLDEGNRLKELFLGKDNGYDNSQGFLIYYSADIIESIKNHSEFKRFSRNFSALHVDINKVSDHVLDVYSFWSKEREPERHVFVTKNGFYYKNDFYDFNFDRKNDDLGLFTTIHDIEKMSKSKLNSINPDDLVVKYGADTFRMYEMFLGPVEQSKPWDTKGIEGVHRFLRKFWRLYVDEMKGLIVNNDAATPAELKVLHKAIKKIEEDTERFSFNTAVSAFMVCVNELNDLKCHKSEVLEPLLILLTPYAPHIAEELWKLSANAGSVLDASFPKFKEQYLVESSKEYPVSINGRHRTNINISLSATQQEVEQIVLGNETVQKWLEGKTPKKVIFVKGRMVNVVI